MWFSDLPVGSGVNVVCEYKTRGFLGSESPRKVQYLGGCPLQPCLLAFPGVKCLTVSCHLPHKPGHSAAVPALSRDGIGVT